jgi:putative hydrolase of the HAD superfamily
LSTALEIKPGALTLLPYLRSIGKKIAIITEGPQDAQEWTLEKLGLSSYVDALVTTNKFGKAKTEGSFASVLEFLGIEGREMVYVGDSYARDIVPAREEGIRTVYLREGEGVVLGLEGMRVDSLLVVERVLRLRDGEGKGT